jgi:repressor LexA
MENYSNLSNKQKTIFDFIIEYFNINGISPTIEDVRVGCEISSKSVVSYNLEILENKGLLDRKKGIARSITRVDGLNSGKPKEVISIPLISTISAGIPLELMSSEEIIANQNSDYDSIEFPASMVSNHSSLVALKISGDSMIEDSIEDGDIVILDCSKDKNWTPKNGEMVVARVDEDTATLKRIFKKGKEIELKPSNKNYSSIITNEKNVMIDGKVVALVRKF